MSTSGYYFSREFDELGLEAASTPLAKEARCLSWLGTASALSTRQSKATISLTAPHPHPLLHQPSLVSSSFGSMDIATLKLRLGSVIAHSLSSVVRTNEIGGLCGPRTLFDCPGEKCASITVAKYMERLVKYTPTTPEVFLSTLIYADRLQRAHVSPIVLTRMNIHRIIASCFVVASKFQEDTYYSNRFYAKVTGLSIEELNSLEREALWRLGFWLVVDSQTWAAYWNACECLMQIEHSFGDIPIFFKDLIRQLRASWALASGQAVQVANHNVTMREPSPPMAPAMPTPASFAASPGSVPATPLAQPAVPSRQHIVSPSVSSRTPPIDSTITEVSPPAYSHWQH